MNKELTSLLEKNQRRHSVPPNRWSLQATAAAQGEPIAQFRLGVSYIEGQGVPQDVGEAVKWLRMAVKQISQADEQEVSGALGLVWHFQTHSEDFAMGYVVLSVAAAQDQGNQTVAKYRRQMAKQLSDEELAAARDLASDLGRLIGASESP